mmetsp:Transcript_2987/g.9033  ORF Transcript_2987/g.9033 Transcript_2987/m.9033 type:complete len:112 (+) Transcript_2987:552-887(+)
MVLKKSERKKSKKKSTRKKSKHQVLKILYNLTSLMLETMVVAAQTPPDARSSKQERQQSQQFDPLWLPEYDPFSPSNPEYMRQPTRCSLFSYYHGSNTTDNTSTSIQRNAQ